MSVAEGYGLKVPYLNHDGQMHVHLSSMDNIGVTLISGLTVDEDGQLYDSGRILNAQEQSSSDLNDVTRMKKIALQCLLALAYSPELFEEADSSASMTRGTSQRRKQKRSLTRSPRWLRPHGVPSVGRHRQGGSHASPRPHWCSAHEKRVPVGPRAKNERKVVRIKPTWVNPIE